MTEPTGLQSYMLMLARLPAKDLARPRFGTWADTYAISEEWVREYHAREIDERARHRGLR